MRRALASTFLLCTLAAAGCRKSEPGAQGAACEQKDDCISGLSCVDGVCTKLDAGEITTATDYCTTLTSLAGSWTFDTTVIGAEDLAPRGINGHFQMKVHVEGCAGTIELTKTGHDDVVYTKNKIQRSEATLSESKRIPGAAEVTVSLKGKPTHVMTFMVRDGKLFGFYNYAESEWTRAGMWGYLRGVPEGGELSAVEDFAVQPCEVKCLTQCDAVRREFDGTLDAAALSSCMQSCGGEQPNVGCGPGTPLHEQLRLAVSGPVKTFDELCAKAGADVIAASGHEGAETSPTCKTEPEIKGKPSARKLGKSRFAGSFFTAQVIEIGFLDIDSGYTGHLLLALETDGGWYWTAPLADLSVMGLDGISVGLESLTLRPRDVLSATGREALVEYGVRTTDSDLGLNEVAIDETDQVVVCTVGAPPSCLRTTTRWSSERTLIDSKGDDPKKHPDLHSARGELYIALLPGDLVSISAPSDAREADRALTGIYAWPSP